MRVPTLLYMAAETELYDPAAAAARAASLMPDVEATVVDGAHHGLPFQFPAAAAAAIVDFVGRHEPTARRQHE
jgi:pimeloyl-ACP methyl ester carboxylesterase